MIRIPLEQVSPGMVILPPERELSLWMRRRAQEQGLPETALHLTVREIYEGVSDKKGRWLIVKGEETVAWSHGRQDRIFTFKARPATLWPVMEAA